MFIDQDVKEITSIPCNILNDFAATCSAINWQLDEFGRQEVSLIDGRLCLIPCLISRSEQLVKTENRVILWTKVSPIVEFVQNLFPTLKLIRGEIVNLLPGKSLTPHVDIHWFHKESKRIHIPILTNTKSFLTFEDREYHLQVEKVYEINNRIMHSGFNKGTTDRIHVILDMMPDSTFNYAVSNKQNFMETI